MENVEKEELEVVETPVEEVVPEEDVISSEVPEEEPVLAEEPVAEEQKALIPADGKEPLKARLKEWVRKKIVALKRKPQTIPLLWLLVCSVFYLFSLQALSQSVEKIPFTMGGFSLFINTLFSILILVLFLNTFPKNKKTNYIMMGLVYAFMVAMIVFDIVYRVNFFEGIRIEEVAGPIHYDEFPFLKSAPDLCIVHVVFLGIFAVLFATLPLYTKLIKKIDTSKKLESSQLNEEIDTEDE